MKKYFIPLIITFLTLLSVGCTKQDPFTVTLEKDSIKVKVDSPATVTYTVENNSGNVSVTLGKAIEGITLENSFTGTKGTITFKTTRSESLEETVKLVFNDTKELVEKNLQIHVPSSWNIDPSDPE